jgi:hypothetical protein
MSLRWASTPRRTDRLIVGRNVTLTLTVHIFQVTSAVLFLGKGFIFQEVAEGGTVDASGPQFVLGGVPHRTLTLCAFPARKETYVEKLEVPSTSIM